MAMYLRRFDPAAINPLFLVNRKDELEWLIGEISEYLRDPDANARGPLSFCILGEKGVGKTHFTLAALRKCREQFSDRAIFVDVDCRIFHSARAVMNAIAGSVVQALDDLRRTRMAAVSNELMATAQVLATITRFDDVELKEVYQHLVQWKAAANLKGDQALLRLLRIDFGISIELSSSTSRELTGKVRFDEMRLCNALAALFEDIRRSDIDVVLYIDNMDELSHHYRNPEDREKVKHDTEILLALHRARIVFILAMRTYYSGILPREIGNRRRLQRLPKENLLTILDRRVEGQRAEVKAVLRDPRLMKTASKLAAYAPTPLAFLVWIKALFEEDALRDDRREAGVTRFLETTYATFPADVVRKVVNAFSTPEVPLTHDALSEACEKNEALLNQVIDRQAVLPQDFWDPKTYYTLDPELYIVHPRAALPQETT